jgi:hypothetical protein
MLNNNVGVKTQICITNSGRYDMSHFNSWVNKTNNNISTYTIDRLGVVYEHYNPKENSINNPQIIDICLVNPGWLRLDTNRMIYEDWLGCIYNKNINIKKEEWRGYSLWLKYSEEQISGLKRLITELCDIYNIEQKLIDTKGYHDQVELHEGITFSSNYNKNETIINPYFWEQIK